jgi:hypothetical protein
MATPPPPAAARIARPRSPIRDALLAVASLRVTVVLFGMAIVIVFCGTLAQIDAGIWDVVGKYFRSFYVWIPFQIFFPRSDKWHVPGGFPFFGGWAIGAALLVNLLAAHAVRFRLSWKRAGVLILHAGLVVMMLGELITGMFAVEGMMILPQNSSSNYLEEREKVELAILSPVDDKTEDVVVVPGRLLRKGGLIQNDQLPFDVEVAQYMPNSDEPRDIPQGEANPATAGEGLQLMGAPRREGNGVSSEQTFDAPSAYVTFKEKGTGKSLGTYLLSVWFEEIMPPLPPQKVTVDGKTYGVTLRFKRLYKPYTVQLLQFSHKDWKGMETPKDYRSTVRLVDPRWNTTRQVDIYMNHPLRYGGETFYQASVLGKDMGTVLQVVRNPGWVLPYLSCAMVAGGMIIHFLIQLVGFLSRRAA